MSAWTPPSKIQQAEDRPGSNAPNPLLIVVAFGSQFCGCLDAGWVVPSASLVSFACLLLKLRIHSVQGRHDGVGTTVVRNSAQVIDHAPVLLLLQVGTT